MAGADVEEKIDQLLNFGVDLLDRNELKQLLANHGNNLEAAVNNYFDSQGEGGISSLKAHLRNSQAKWDETAFGGAMYGADDTNIASLENYPHSNLNSRAPTRPPSRTSIASTQAQAGDAPMQSIEDQEMGVIGSNPNFGPATRENYDTSSWALVPTATEIIADPIPSQRKREEGQPAILKPSSNFNYLSSLIPILHSIPLFRNELLCPGVLNDDYWVGDDWWKGSPTETARIFEDSMGRSEAHGLEILHEAQRLMAFLDNTDRIYGSVNALLQTEAWTEAQSVVDDPDDDLLKFLVMWGFALQSNVPDVELNGLLRSTVNVAGCIQESFALDTTVTRDQSRPDFSLYDVLDDTLFSSAMGSAHLRDTSNVLIIRLTSSNTEASDLGCRVPATLYIDRYLEKNKHVIDGMYSDIKQHEERLRAMQAQIEDLKFHSPNKAGAKKVESLQLLRSSMAAFESQEDQPSSEDAKVLHQLQELCKSIENQLTTLDEQTQQVQKTIAGISGRFKPTVDDGANDATIDNAMDTANDAAEKPAESLAVDFPEGQTPADAMQHPYFLYGVATRRDVVYVRHPDIKSDIPGATQWWRMQYDSESSNPIIRRDRLSLQEVIERATTESASALLVYANDDAISVDPIPLPKPLQDFIKRDNLNFLEELQKNTTGWEGYGDYGEAAQGGWDDMPGEWGKNGTGWEKDAFQDNPEWSGIDAKDFHSRTRNDSNMSSATLTPNTEIDDEAPGAQEMVETNPSRSAVPGLSSASSETVGRSDDAMELDVDKLPSKVRFSDVDMADAQDESRAQHIEVAPKKGG
ncbi:ubiquitin interaction motif protein [Stemphylium lycopersici]|uniref:Ubiquitin interaction motif protein n=1 Tax=Stemphylium lycopersici TaxID=183478 RepID=A0A364NAK0_STELY|nr:ubiquitin interaction motif protein [Stemphylium lycopersici]